MALSELWSIPVDGNSGISRLETLIKNYIKSFLCCTSKTKSKISVIFTRSINASVQNGEVCKSSFQYCDKDALVISGFKEFGLPVRILRAALIRRS